MTAEASDAPRETVVARVVARRRWGDTVQLVLHCPYVSRRAHPGQFVMTAVPESGFHLRRPLSIHYVDGDRLSLLVEVCGSGTAAIAAARVDDTLPIGGPLGNGFPLTGARHALLIGGGLGSAPLQFLADVLAARGSAITAVFGFRDAARARVTAAFRLPELYLATDDGSLGRRGTAVDVLDRVPLQPGTELFACGPQAMLRALQSWAGERGMGGFVSLEAHMACGTGVCQGCVVATTRGYVRVCTEGPVLPLQELLFS